MSTKEKVVCVKDITHDEWLAFRRTGIGGSDAATVVGLNPYSSPYYLFCDKRGELAEKEDTEAMRQGRDLEQYVADRWMERTGKKCKRNNYMWRSTKWPFMLADIDREVVGENAGLECKTTSVYNKNDFENGNIQDSYYVQCQHYMAVMGYDRMYLAVLVLNKGFYTYVIERDEEDISQLAQAEGAFWDALQSGQAPDFVGADADFTALSQKYPEGTESLCVTLDAAHDAKAGRLRNLSEMIADLQSQCDEIKAQLMGCMQEAAFAKGEKFTCSWKTQTRSRLDTKRLKAECPDVYEAYRQTSQIRVFKIKENKEETA